MKRLALTLCIASGAGMVGAACHEPGTDGRDAGAVDDAALVPDAQAALRELPIVDNASWRNYPAELDPLRAHQPEPIDCGIAGWFIERGLLEVNTAECNYVLVEHPALLDVPEDSEVLVELWHFDLNAPEPASAHVALLFGDDLQWEQELPIPQLANVQQLSFRSTRALAEGEPVRLHLHNHGQNTWLLASVHALVPVEASRARR